MSHFGSSAEPVAEYGKSHGQKPVKPTLSGAIQVLPHLTTKRAHVIFTATRCSQNRQTYNVQWSLKSSPHSTQHSELQHITVSMVQLAKCNHILAKFIYTKPPRNNNLW